MLVAASSSSAQSVLFGPNTNLNRLAVDLRPLAPQSDQAVSRFQAVAQVLKNNCGLQVHEVVLGGSTAKGTSTRSKLEIDIVVLLKDYRPDKVPQYLDCFEMYVRTNLKVAPPTRRLYSINFTDGDVEVDLLPGGCNATPQMFVELTQADAAYWAASVTKLQLELIRVQPDALKDLVRVAKHWRDEGKRVGVLTTDSAPKSYLLELLALAASREEPNRSLGQQFRDLLRLMIRIHEEQPRFSWQCYYDASVLERAMQLGRLPRPSGPAVIDPANPTNDLWATLRDSATLCMYVRSTLATVCTAEELDGLFAQCDSVAPVDVDLSESSLASSLTARCLKDLGYYFRGPKEPATGDLPAPARDVCEWLRTTSPTQRPKTFGALVRTLQSRFRFSVRVSFFVLYWLQRCHVVTDTLAMLPLLRFSRFYHDPTAMSVIDKDALMWSV